MPLHPIVVTSAIMDFVPLSLPSTHLANYRLKEKLMYTGKQFGGQPFPIKQEMIQIRIDGIEDYTYIILYFHRLSLFSQ